jgi:hypothetical protein
LEHLGVKNVSESFVSAVAIEGELFVVQAMQVKHRGVQVRGAAPFDQGTIAKIIGGPVNLAARDSPAGQQDAEPIPMMVSAILALGPRGPAKLAFPNDQR